MLTKGTTAKSEGDLAKELDTYAISLSGGAGADSSSVTAACVTDQIDHAVKLLAEVVLTPTFPAKEFEKLRSANAHGPGDLDQRARLCRRPRAASTAVRLPSLRPHHHRRNRRR